MEKINYNLFLGSPMWTDYSIMGKFETGRVYVVYQDKNVRIFLDLFYYLI